MVGWQENQQNNITRFEYPNSLPFEARRHRTLLADSEALRGSGTQRNV